MSSLDLQMLLNAGDDLFTSLEQETLACLKGLESLPVEEIERFVERRQELCDAIQNFDTSFISQCDRVGAGAEAGSMKKFRRRQTALLGRVIEADGLLLALARIELTSLRAKQALISQGRHALHGYGEEGRENQQFSLKRIV